MTQTAHDAALSAASRALVNWIDNPPATEPTAALVNCTPAMVAGVVVNAYRKSLAVQQLEGDVPGKPWQPPKAPTLDMSRVLAWVCYSRDSGIAFDAVFDKEIDALRYAVDKGYLKVAPLRAGEIGQLP